MSLSTLNVVSFERVSIYSMITFVSLLVCYFKISLCFAPKKKKDLSLFGYQWLAFACNNCLELLRKMHKPSINILKRINLCYLIKVQDFCVFQTL